MNKTIVIIAVVLCAAVSVFCLCGGLVFYSFSSVSSGYEVSGGRVYYRDFNNLNWQVERKEVPGANASTMRTLPGAGGLYGSDGESVYFEGTIFTDADPASFEVIDWREEYSRDKHRVYWKSIPISHSPSSFQILGGNYAKDAEQVYYVRNPIEGADPATFVVTDNKAGEARDRTHQYRKGHKVD